MSDRDKFYKHVLQKASELRDQIDGLKSPELDQTARDTIITQCLAEISTLKNGISSHAYETAPHDQRTFNETLKGLTKKLEEVRTEVAPKRKFAFKPKAQQAGQPLGSSDPGPIAAGNIQPVGGPSEHFSGSGLGGFQQPSVLNDTHHALRTESDLEHADRGVMIANISHCVIKCLIPHPKLTINEVQTSVIVSGPVNGAALVMGMTASVLVISCRQLRLHRCRDCVLYLRCSSRPIIEECSGVQFAPFPNNLDVMPLAGTTSDCWDQVDDFNWLKTGHSPNWRILEPEDRIEADHWKRLPAITEAEAGDVLQIFGATGPNDQHEASKRPIVA